LTLPKDIIAQAVRSTEDLLRKSEADLARERRKAEEYFQGKEQEIAQLKRTAEVLRRELKELEAVSSPASGSSKLPAAQAEYVIQADIIREESFAILREHKGPLKQKEIAKIMARRGVSIDSANPPDLIRATLNRDPRFVRIPYQGYVLKDGAREV
jgi:hypothetical protein